MMRPWRAPTEDARPLFRPAVLQRRHPHDLSVGRMKFNVRVGRDAPEGPMTLSNEDILDVVKLLGLKDGRGQVDDIDHLCNRRVRCVGEPMETKIPLGSVAWRR